MAYLISCSGSKKNPFFINESNLGNLSYNDKLFEARTAMIKLSKIELDWNNCLPAWQLYTGRLYSRVLEKNWLKPNAEIMILSALFGWINHTDLIPKYDLAMTDRINGLYVWSIWHNLNILQDFIIGVTDIDLLSTSYRKSINYNGTYVAQAPNVKWRDNYGFHKGEWLNEQLKNL